MTPHDKIALLPWALLAVLVILVASAIGLGVWALL